jgi:hypothetical protein
MILDNDITFNAIFYLFFYNKFNLIDD